MPVVHHIPETVSNFLEGCDVADAAGTVGEALLAVALGAGNADSRKRAKDLIKKSKQKRLLGALKALPRRVYDDSHSSLVEDLALLEQMGEIDVPAYAFHLYMFGWRYKAAWGWCAAHVSEDYVRAEVQSLLEKDPTRLRLERAFGSAALYPVLRKLRGVEVLYFEVADACPMVDLSHLKGLKNLGVSGPVQDLPAECVKGLPLESLFLQDSGIRDLSALAAFPALSSLVVRTGELSVLPTAPWPALEVLDLRKVPLTSLPSFAQLASLKELKLEWSPIAPIPEDITACTQLETVSLSGLPLTTLPEGLGKLRLKKLVLASLHLHTLPRWDGAVPPAHVTRVELTIDDPAPSPSAFGFLQLPSTAVLAKELLSYLDHACMTKGPRVQAALKAWQDGADLAGAKLPELLVAISRTYHDEEHGPSTNKHLAKVIAEQGGPVERAASELIPASESRKASTFAEHAKTLGGLKGFDVAAYEAFAKEIVGL